MRGPCPIPPGQEQFPGNLGVTGDNGAQTQFFCPFGSALLVAGRWDSLGGCFSRTDKPRTLDRICSDVIVSGKSDWVVGKPS